MESPLNLFKFGQEEALPFRGERLDVFLAAVLGRSRNHAQGLLKQGLVRLSPSTAKATASYRLRAGDSVEVHPGQAGLVPPELAGGAIPLDILYEDEVLLALN